MMRCVRCGLTAAALLAVATQLMADRFEFGESSEFGEGSVSSYVRLDSDGNVEAHGVKMTASALNGLGTDPESDRHTRVSMPEGPGACMHAPVPDISTQIMDRFKRTLL